jgi:23S rRNA pseudouridine2605 synthase
MRDDKPVRSTKSYVSRTSDKTPGKLDRREKANGRSAYTDEKSPTKKYSAKPGAKSAQDFRSSDGRSQSQSQSQSRLGARDKFPSRHEERTEHRAARRSQLQSSVSPQLASQSNQPVEKSALLGEGLNAERIQKVLAREGLGSRRDLERLIYQGEVVVNGVVAQLGDKVSPGDKIVFQGKEVFFDKPATVPQILVYHKPPGEICSQKDPEDRPSVFDRIPACTEGRWVMVGRLDFNSSGLLMFTNSGELANQLMHPKYQIEREYAVRIFGELSDEHIDRLLKGIRLEDGFARFKSVVFGGGEGKNRWYNVVLTEGRNREIRRMFEAVGFTVSRLMRIRFGTVQLPSTLLQGKRAILPDNQVVKLMDLLNQQSDASPHSPAVKMHIHAQKKSVRH